MAERSRPGRSRPGRSRAGQRALTQREFRILAATTLGYYLVRDVVTRTWPRRIGQAAVLAVGTGVILADEWDALSDEERGEVRSSWARVGEDLDAGTGRGLMLLAAGGTAAAGAAGAAAWLTGRMDAAGAALVSRTGGKLPLVGGIFRALPSTVYGAVQVGVVYVVNERVSA
jgi:hypothetical protein